MEILKCAYKLRNNLLPHYFDSIDIQYMGDLHDHYTRSRNRIRLSRTKHSFAENTMSYIVPHILDCTDKLITDKILTHSFHGYSMYIKNKFINSYSDQCQIRNCYICS